MEELAIGVGIIGSILIYFIPSVVAYYRAHNNMVPIFVLNLLLGFTFVGWVLSLVWALTNDRRKPF